MFKTHFKIDIWWNILYKQLGADIESTKCWHLFCGTIQTLFFLLFQLRFFELLLDLCVGFKFGDFAGQFITSILLQENNFLCTYVCLGSLSC